MLAHMWICTHMHTLTNMYTYNYIAKRNGKSQPKTMTRG